MKPETREIKKWKALYEQQLYRNRDLQKELQSSKTERDAATLSLEPYTKLKEFSRFLSNLLMQVES